MSITTITIGGVDYISYASLAEANAYLAADITRSAAWTALANDDERGRRLVAATRLLDLLDYSGEKVSATQANQWPRNNATCNGESVTNADVPLELQNATIVQAGSIAVDPSVADPPQVGGSNIKRVRAGTAEIENFRPVSGNATIQDTATLQLVRCLLRSTGSGIGFGTVSGLTGENAESAFTDRDAPERSEGF